MARTICCNAAVAIVATIVAIPAAIVLGRGRGVLASLLWLVLPVSLLLPSLVFAYGWKQLFRLINFDFEPAGLLDVCRCVWSLAAWLWPIPAFGLGLALRRVDTQVQQQALLDGALWRTTARQLLGPAIASVCVVMMLAMQEFAVYEPTGISVVATEVRMVFETGAFSSPENPITQPLTGAVGLADQPARAAAAVATALPVLTIIAMLGATAWVVSRRWSAFEQIEHGVWPRSLDAGLRSLVLSWLIILLTLGAPIVALVLSMKRPLDAMLIWTEFGPQVTGSIIVAAMTCVVATLVALAAAVRRSHGATIVALLSFLIGGQLVAIALIRLYNRPWLSWVYDGPLIAVMAYIARFGWIALFGASATWSSAWRPLRDMSAIDGAGALPTATRVIWPLAWPIFAASALVVAALALTEVPATVLISPQRPQMLVPLLMTWVHMLRYDAMIEASLLMVAMVASIGVVAVVLGWVGFRARGNVECKRENIKSATSSRTSTLLLFTFYILHACGCDRGATPDAIWCDTGTGPGQVVYPRGITYRDSDDTFFIVDRSAHVQHLDRAGRCLGEWRMPQFAQGKPVGLSVGPDGNLYVPDTHYHRVIVYRPDGTEIRRWGTRGTGPGQFMYPTDIAFDSKGRIYVSEYGDNDRIQVFDQNLNFLFSFGAFGSGDGLFSRPQSMLIDGDQLFVTDSCNHRICVFKTDGT
ncbi:MAG: hypothetical protein ACREJC_17855, partial [Tepidisphaeraceae bacterium]